MSRGVLATLVALALAAGAAGAQTRPEAPGPATPYANSWALVIGINNYEKVSPRLNYAVADAKAVAEALPGLGFPREQIRVLLDGAATKARIETMLYREFARMRSEDRLFVFFAGHGETLTIRGGEEGYLLPVDADPEALPLTAIAMDDVKRISQRLKAKHYLFVIDACFSGFALTRDIVPTSTTDEYIASALREPVVQVITAGRKGERVIEEGGHGLFTRRLLDGLRGLADPDDRGMVTAAQLAAWIEPRVVRDSKGRMTPQYGKLDGEGQFIFVRPGAQLAKASPPAPTPKISEEARRDLGSLSLSSTVSGVEVWLDGERLGETKVARNLVISDLAPGTHRVRARKQGFVDWEREYQLAPSGKLDVTIDLQPLKAGDAAPAPLQSGPVVAAIPPPATFPGVTVRPLGRDQTPMVFVPDGPFQMGAGEDDPKATSAERPQRTVTLTGYWLDQYEVTNARYTAFREATRYGSRSYFLRDPRFNGPNQPVVGVTWEDASEYCKWAGKRLPTEAEWEKAARGTDGRLFPWGNADVTEDLAQALKQQTSDVGAYPRGASPYGLLDMAGNVWEWVQDWWDANYYRKDGTLTNPRGPSMGGEKVLRGGSWWERDPGNVQTTKRHHQPPDRAHNNVGFRCALTAGPDRIR